MHSLSLSFLSAALALATAADAAKAFKFGQYPPGWVGTASFKQQGTTGVAPMQLVVTTNNRIVMVDRIENNPLKNGKNPYWAAELNLDNGSVRGLGLATNSFCAGGGFLGDGTLVTVGGDEATGYGGKNGLQGLRTFKPCSDNSCQFNDNPSKTHLTSGRWYPFTVKMTDGSLLIGGGVSNHGQMTDNPTFEYYPPRGNGKAIYSKFLHDALQYNLFPHAMLLPSGKVYLAANGMSMIYDRLPNFPNNVRITYPFSAASALLPLTPENNYQPEVLFCGGHSVAPGTGVGTQTPGTTQCSRMVLTSAGIAAGWQIEQMPEARVMGNAVLTPDGKIIIINGAGTGTAGYYNTRNAQTGYASADHPVLTPYLYDPTAPAGNRFINMGAKSSIARMYHSVASLLPDGRIIVAGSNPGPDVSYQQPYPTEYRIEYFSPPYLNSPRPAFSGYPGKIGYGQTYNMNIVLPTGADATKVTAVLMDLAYSTHAVQYNARLVKLSATVNRNGAGMTFTGPPNSGIFPPGPAWLYITSNGAPSRGFKVMVG